jgi:hypothetical protein
VQLKREWGGGDASSPQGERDAFVASFHLTSWWALRRPGDEGVAATPKRRGVASTLMPAAQIGINRAFRAKDSGAPHKKLSGQP